MPIVFDIAASIECAAAHLKFRRFNPKFPRKNTYPSLNVKYLYYFKLDLNSTSIIAKELDPKEFIISANSMLDLGDGLQGDTISILSTTNVRPDDATVAPGSASHQASYIKVNDYVHAKIEKTFRGIGQMVRLNSTI